MSYSQDYIDLLDRMKQLHKDKNAGYAGDSEDPWVNLRECESFNIPMLHGVITRMCDKWMRFQNLWTNPDNDRVGESIIDTLEDLGSYAFILSLLLRDQQKNEFDYTYFTGVLTVKE